MNISPIIFTIALHLEPKDIFCLLSVNKKIHATLNDYFWQVKLFQDFNLLTDEPKTMYQNLYLGTLISIKHGIITMETYKEYLHNIMDILEELPAYGNLQVYSFRWKDTNIKRIGALTETIKKRIKDDQDKYSCYVLYWKPPYRNDKFPRMVILKRLPSCCRRKMIFYTNI